MQIFSNKTAAALYTAVGAGCFNEKDAELAISMAKFAKRLNMIFDNLNSKQEISKNPARCAISKDNSVKDNIRQMVEYVQTWRRLPKKQQKIWKRLPCYNGFIQTLLGILGICEEYLNDEAQKFIVTSRFNQDPLENHFSILRNFKGSYESNPSTYTFCKNFAICLFQSTKAPEMSSYEETESTHLLTVNDVLTSESLQGKIHFLTIFF